MSEPSFADLEVLRAAIEKSGLSTRRFAADVLSRDERRVRRWIAGEDAIPPAVIAFLRRLHSVTVDETGRVITELQPADD